MILRSPSSLLLAHQLQIHLQPPRCSVQPVCCFNKQKTVNRRGGGIVVVRSYESRQIYHPVFLQHPWHWPPPWWGGNQRKYDVWHNSDGDDDNENGQLMFAFSYHCGDIDPILISHSEIKNGINLTEWMNFDGFLDSNLRSWLSCLALTKWSLLLGLDPNSPQLVSMSKISFIIIVIIVMLLVKINFSKKSHLQSPIFGIGPNYGLSPSCLET